MLLMQRYTRLIIIMTQLPFSSAYLDDVMLGISITWLN